MFDPRVNPENVNPHFLRPTEFGLTPCENDSVANTVSDSTNQE